MKRRKKNRRERPPGLVTEQRRRERLARDLHAVATDPNVEPPEEALGEEWSFGTEPPGKTDVDALWEWGEEQEEDDPNKFDVSKKKALIAMLLAMYFFLMAMYVGHYWQKQREKEEIECVDTIPSGE